MSLIRLRRHAALCLALSALPLLPAFASTSLEGTALWLEQVPGTSDVLVVASWPQGADGCCWGGIQGWSYGVCHDPAEARIADGVGVSGDPCRCRPEYPDSDFCSRCRSVQCPPDLITGPCLNGEPPEFQTVHVLEDGVAQGVALMGCIAGSGPEDRIELLRISYEGLAETATLRFCDTLGQPPVSIVFLLGGASYAPERTEGLVLTFQAPFLRGDANASGAVDLADAVFVVRYLFRFSAPPVCPQAADANDDGALNVADGVAILYHLFRSTGPLPAPFGVCGLDPTPDTGGLVCPEFPPCR